MLVELSLSGPSLFWGSANMAKILVVEDEIDLASCLKTALEKESHLVEIIVDGESARRHLNTYDFDLIILDWMLPGESGVDLCKHYRGIGGEAQVMMLTARTSVDDRAEGLDAGADDYLAKPFHMKEFLARVRALLRRTTPSRSHILRIGDLILDTRSSEVEYNKQRNKLLKKELDILVFLIKHPGQCFTGEDLLNRIWSADSIVTTETVRTHIKNLRRKLELLGRADLVKHVRGLGYGVDNNLCSQVSEYDSLSSSFLPQA
jgi:two-component system, OmpR family, manganese sensing response regulator